jgi:hypothetical protein
MRTLISALLLVVATTSVVGAVGAVPEGQVAQQANQTQTDEPTTVVAQVDDRLRVTDYRYDAENETFWVEVDNSHATRGSTVTVTESIGRSGSEKSRSFGIARVDVEAGEQLWLSVSARRVDGLAAVTVVTDLSLEQKRGVYLEEDGETAGLFDDEASGNDVRAAGGFAIGVVALGCILGAWRYLARRDEPVEAVDVGGDS